MSVYFRPQILWPNNKQPLPFNLYGGKWLPEKPSQFDPTALTDDPRFDPNQSFPRLHGVQIPAGLSRDHVRAPNFVTTTQLQQLAQANPATRTQLSLVNGLVTPSLEVRFANVQTQWRRVSAAGTPTAPHGPCTFQFLGGDVFLDLILTLHIADTYTPQPRDPISVELFATVYSHELLHVLDAVDIFTHWLLPARVNSEPSVARYLVQAQPYSFGQFRQPIHQVEQDFHRHIQADIQNTIRGLWGSESDRRTALRDTPVNYATVQQRVNFLHRWQNNPKIRHRLTR